MQTAILKHYMLQIRRKRQPRMRFIHGVGDAEIQLILGRYYEASFIEAIVALTANFKEVRERSLYVSKPSTNLQFVRKTPIEEREFWMAVAKVMFQVSVHVFRNYVLRHMLKIHAFTAILQNKSMQCNIKKFLFHVAVWRRVK